MPPRTVSNRRGSKGGKLGRPRKATPEQLQFLRLQSELDMVIAEETRRSLDGLYAFQSMPENDKFFRSEAQYNVVRGGNQSSKTLTCAVKFASWARNIVVDPSWSQGPVKRKGRLQLLAVGISQDHLSKVVFQKLCKPGAYFKWRLECPKCGQDLFLFPDRVKTVLMQGEVGGNFSGYRGVLNCTTCDWQCDIDDAKKAWRWEAPPLIPASAIRNISWQNKGLEIPGIVETEHADVHFRTAGSGRQNFQGFQPDGVWIDEELGSEADGVWEELVRGLMAKGSPLLWSATPLAKQDALIELHDRAATDKDVDETLLGLANNHHLPTRSREATIRNWPDWQRPCRVNGQFLVLEGLVYPEFKVDIHIVDEETLDLDAPEWKDEICWYRGIDPGLNVSAVLWFAVDKNNDYIIYDEVYLRGGNVQTLAKDILEKSKGRNIINTVIDPADQRSLACREGLKKVLLRDYAIPTHSRFNRDVNEGIMRVKEDLVYNEERKRPRLQISSRCVNTIRELQRYRRGDRKASSDQSGKVVKRDDHSVDVIRYRVMAGLKYRDYRQTETKVGSYAYHHFKKMEAARLAQSAASRSVL